MIQGAISREFLFIRWVICAAVILTAPICAHGQAEFSGLPRPGTPTFDLDFAPFRLGADSVRIEVYYRIVNHRLSYLRRTADGQDSSQSVASDTADESPSDYYVAAYEMAALLSGESDRQVASTMKRENYRLETFDETRSNEGYLVNVLSMTVVPGNYLLTTTLTDRISGASHSTERDVDVRHFAASDWRFGGPAYFDPAARAPEYPAFARGGQSYVPNVRRSFAGMSDRVAFFMEVYQSPSAAAVAVEIAIDQKGNRDSHKDTLRLDSLRMTDTIVYKNDLAGLRTGEVRMRAATLNREGQQLGESLESLFWIDWTVGALVHDSWEEAVDMLVHIASHDQLDSLRNASESERERLFRAFWKLKDPTPETDENEWQQEYYRRIRFSDLRFTTPFRRGWRTDFGTVYVRYGEPDEIERFPFESGQKPYQIWNYYQQNRQFLFVDVRGNGDYELQYPYDGYHR